ncbi:Retrovirus-related Pol polyprotein from transposon [Nosema granulosis]|uniref:Retrovirus-related Pol polyprotein from transposon n=1 Tax=Nosema granulosis TaxID=83296 RepID=A0A9P6GWA8_9MICR|nr:Retrovirus-related Pol polyprotein from transposon [Nosema granulosis]
MVMGYKNSPQILQRIMDQSFRSLKGKGVEIYMDDIVIYGKTKEEHDRLCREVISRLAKNNMKLNKSKIQYCKEEVKLLGVTVNGRDIKLSEVKKNEALEFPVPKNVSEVRRFLGLTGLFRDFIKDYAGKTLALTDSLRGKNNNWEWTAEMEQEFTELKKVIQNLGNLKVPDYERKFLLSTDASKSGMGAVLMQKNEKGEWVPVQWSSKKFTPTEVRYGISEKEMYAVFFFFFLGGGKEI